MTDGEKPIRLLIFIHDLAPFGAQRVALTSLQAAPRGPLEVTVCSFWGDETLAGEFESAGAKLVMLRARRYLDLAAWRRLFRLLRELKPDIVQTNLPELSVPVRVFSVLAGAAKVFHAVQNPFSSEPWYWRLLNLLTLRLCAGLAYSSRSIMEEAALPGWAVPAITLVIQNGMAIAPAPAGAREELRSTLAIRPEETAICCVARLCGQKGQDILLAAAARLVGEGRKIKVLLAGDGETEPELRAMTERLGLAGKVLFLGRRDDIPSVLAASDIYAGPSRWEGLGLALGEAMLAGKPCAASAISGHADILFDGVTGLAVPKEDMAALAGAIASLMDDPGRGSKLASAGGELISREFSVGAMAEKYMRTYYLMGRKDS
ncbi:MAG: glycosyltransferase [Elusimicrobiales bacterium]